MSHFGTNRGHQGPDRATFLKIAGLGLGAACTGAPLEAVAAGAAPPRAATTPAAALSELKAGDARFMAGKPINCGNQTARMAQLGQGQNPFAIILGCSDSRVPNETVFDQAPGHLFGVRVAGNYATADGIGSIEYAVAVLGAPLILVLGHEGCGAIKATVAYVKDGTTVPGHIQDVVNALVPSVKAAQSMSGDWVINATNQNVRDTCKALSAKSTILSDAVAKSTLQIYGGVYNISTSRVTFIS